MAKTAEERAAEESKRLEQEAEELAAFGPSRKVRRTSQGLPILSEDQEEEEPSESEQESGQGVKLKDIQTNTGKYQKFPETQSNSTLLGNRNFPPQPIISFSYPTIKICDSSKGSLRNHPKLKGEENYDLKKQNITSLAEAISVNVYIHPMCKPPKKIDRFVDTNYTKEELEEWRAWKAGDSMMPMLISHNIKEIPQSLITNYKTAREM